MIVHLLTETMSLNLSGQSHEGLQRAMALCCDLQCFPKSQASECRARHLKQAKQQGGLRLAGRRGAHLVHKFQGTPGALWDMNECQLGPQGSTHRWPSRPRDLGQLSLNHSIRNPRMSRPGQNFLFKLKSFLSFSDTPEWQD